MKTVPKIEKSLDTSYLKEISKDAYAYFLSENLKKEKRKKTFLQKLDHITGGKRIVMTNSSK